MNKRSESMGIEKEPKNHLDSFDFCLRKSIAVHVFGKNKDETLAEFARAIDTTQPTLSKWMSMTVDSKHRITPQHESRHAPSASHIILASAYLSMPVAEMIDEAIKGEETANLIPSGMLEKMRKLSKKLHENGVAASPKRSEKRSPDYLKKIKRAAYSRFIGFYIQDGAIQHMIIETYETYKTGSVPLVARIIGKAGNPYRGNVVSPPGNDHLYFYIRQEDGKNDRGIMIFYIDDDMQDTYKCGSGIILSNDRKTGKIRLQWIVILRTGKSSNPISKDTMQILEEMQAREQEINFEDREYEKSLGRIDGIIKPILEESIPEPNGNYLQFYSLRGRQEKLYELYQQLYQDEVSIAEKRVAYTKAQYEEALARLDEIRNR